MNRIVQRARGLNQGVAVTEDDTPGFGNYDTYTLEDVLLERARELCFERWRWYDLARTGMFEHFLENRNGFSTTKTSFDSDKNYLFPIQMCIRDSASLCTWKESSQESRYAEHQTVCFGQEPLRIYQIYGI